MKLFEVSFSMTKRNPAIIGVIAIIELLSMILETHLTNAVIKQILYCAILPITLYYLIWQCTFQEQIKKETGEGQTAWGHFWATLFTLGIYIVVWHFAVGKRLNKLGAKDRSKIYGFIYLISFTVSMTFVVLVLREDINYANDFVFDVIRLVNSLIPYALFMHMQYSANRLPPRAEAIQNPIPIPPTQVRTDEIKDCVRCGYKVFHDSPRCANCGMIFKQIDPFGSMDS